MGLHSTETDTVYSFMWRRNTCRSLIANQKIYMYSFVKNNFTPELFPFPLLFVSVGIWQLLLCANPTLSQWKLACWIMYTVRGQGTAKRNWMCTALHRKHEMSAMILSWTRGHLLKLLNNSSFSRFGPFRACFGLKINKLLSDIVKDIFRPLFVDDLAIGLRGHSLDTIETFTIWAFRLPPSAHSNYSIFSCPASSAFVVQPCTSGGTWTIPNMEFIIVSYGVYYRVLKN